MIVGLVGMVLVCRETPGSQTTLEGRRNKLRMCLYSGHVVVFYTRVSVA